MKFGIDVSRNNGRIDWKKVASNVPKVDFCIIKASEGMNFADPRFVENVAGCVANGIPWGAYHFATWNNEDEVADAKAEALFFLRTVGAAVAKYGKPQLPLVLDIESNKAIPYTRDEMNTFVRTFLNELISAGYQVAIYSSPGFLNSYLPVNHQFGKYPLWIADYTGAINKVPGWKQPWIHQYTDQGKCAGVATSCDLNKVL